MSSSTDLKMDDTGTSIVPVLACVLTQLCLRNDRLPMSQKGISKFHALRPPGISIREYLQRIAKYAACSGECFVLSLVYIDRIIQSNPTFVVNSLNIHRLLITSIMLAAKFFDDQYYNNAYYAKVGGVPCNEVNSLEVEFLFMCNFTLFVSSDTYHQYYTELGNHASNKQNLCQCHQGQTVPTLELPSNHLVNISFPPADLNGFVFYVLHRNYSGGNGNFMSELLPMIPIEDEDIVAYERTGIPFNYEEYDKDIERGVKEKEMMRRERERERDHQHRKQQSQQQNHQNHNSDFHSTSSTSSFSSTSLSSSSSSPVPPSTSTSFTSCLSAELSKHRNKMSIEDSQSLSNTLSQSGINQQRTHSNTQNHNHQNNNNPNNNNNNEMSDDEGDTNMGADNQFVDVR